MTMNQPPANPRCDAFPRRVLLFSGHMIDAPDRGVPRFPPDREPAARVALERLLDELNAGPADLGICGGACGGDLLFAEAVLSRAVPLELYLPFDESAFLARSVDYAGDSWHARYLAVRAACSLLDVAPDVSDGDDDGVDGASSGQRREDPFEQNNLRMLDAASRFGAERVHFICLWNGGGGDGPGGTQHLMQEVTQRQGRTYWLDTTSLWS
jgi:hypothetical protein